MIKSPLRYPGGKTRALKFLAAYFPENITDYREPFVGGGSVFAYVKQRFEPDLVWLNDIYFPLSEFYFWLQQSPDLVVEIVRSKIEDYPVGRELYDHCLLLIASGSHDVNTAAAFFILNRITFSGTAESGGFSSQAYKSRLTESSIDRLCRFAPLLKGKMRLTSADYQLLLEDSWADSFTFLDPPYYSVQKSKLYGRNGDLHRGFDYQRLAQLLRRCRGKWMMTIDDDPFIRKLFRGYRIVSWSLQYGMNNVNGKQAAKGKELLIMNY